MPIASTIIGGIIAGAGALGASVIGSKATSKAAAATTQAADTSAQVVRENYDKSAAALQPWQQSGLAANNQINAMLGLSPTQQTTQQATQPNAMSQFHSGDAGNWQMPYNISADGVQGVDPWFGGQGWQNGFQAMQGVQQPQTINTATQSDPNAGFRQYIANSDYGFQLGEGQNRVNSGYAGAGTLQSGAAMRGMEDYRQNLQQGYRGEYMGALGNQQALGASAASAQAGVSQQLGNSLANIYTNQGQNQAALAAASGQNNAALVNSLATIGAGIFGKKS